MKIINIVVIRKGIIEDIYSYPINKDDEEGIQVKRAEEKFIDLCIEAGANREDEEDLLDIGYYDNMNGYEITLIWSNVYEK